MIQRYKKNGFTIIELTLAMTFLSILLIMITMMVMRVSDIYNRGLTIKDVNQAGRVIVRDLQQTISQSRSFDVGDGANNTKNYVISKSGDNVYGGRLCTGEYSYIWNYAKRITDTNTVISSNNSNLGYPGSAHVSETGMMRLIKVPDSTAYYCSLDQNNLFPNVDTSSAQDMLGVDDLTLALYNFSITRSAYDSKTGQGLYYISFTLGTDSAAAANQNAVSCKPSDNLDISYCSVSQFNMVVRAGNEVQ